MNKKRQVKAENEITFYIYSGYLLISLVNIGKVERNQEENIILHTCDGKSLKSNEKNRDNFFFFVTY